MTTSSDPAARSPALFRDGLSSARRELQAGTARRHRADAVRVAGRDLRSGPSRSPVADHGTGSGAASGAGDGDGGYGVSADDGAPTGDLATQRAGVRAALAELRQHRGATNRGGAS